MLVKLAPHPRMMADFLTHLVLAYNPHIYNMTRQHVLEQDRERVIMNACRHNLVLDRAHFWCTRRDHGSVSFSCSTRPPACCCFGEWGLACRHALEHLARVVFRCAVRRLRAVEMIACI